MRRIKKDSILLHVLLAIVIIGLFFVISNGVRITKLNENYKKALSAEISSDICATPLGYTDEQWKEHMSHHPDRYKQCLS